jgi:hypothetical protein
MWIIIQTVQPVFIGYSLITRRTRLDSITNRHVIKHRHVPYLAMAINLTKIARTQLTYTCTIEIRVICATHHRGTYFGLM